MPVSLEKSPVIDQQAVDSEFDRLVAPQLERELGQTAVEGMTGETAESTTLREQWQVDKQFYSETVDQFKPIEAESEQEANDRFNGLSNFVMDRGLGLSKEMSDSLNTSLAFKDTLQLKKDMLKGLVEKAIYPEDAERLHQTFGIINYDFYSSEQLDRMNKLAARDPETVEAFSKSDAVRIVTIDSHADYNRAFRHIPNAVENNSPDELTIFSEIADPEAYDRLAKVLADRDIKPSALIVGAHGRPGAIGFGAQFKYGISHGVNTLRSTTEEITPLEDSSLKRFIDGSMQDNAKGEKHVVFFSCHLAQAPSPTTEAFPQKMADETGAVVWASETSSNVKLDSSYAGNRMTESHLKHDEGGTVRFEAGTKPAASDIIDYQVTTKKQELHL